MVNEENLNKVYEAIIEDKELTTKLLNEYGFNSVDLTNLVNNGTLSRIKRGQYKLVKAYDLYKYGKNLKKLNEDSKSWKCYEKAYEIDPSNVSVCIKLLSTSIYNSNYEETFKYYSNLLNIGSKYYSNDYNFYLFMIKYLTELPNEYKEMAKNLELKDILIHHDDFRYKDVLVSEYNKIRSLCFKQKFIEAYKEYEKLINKNGISNPNDEIVKHLIFKARESFFKFKNDIVLLAKLKKYDSIIEYYDEIKNIYNLGNGDRIVISISKEILNITKTRIIPKISMHKSERIEDVLESKNYKLAYSLICEYINYKEIDKNSYAIYILLKDINDLVNEIAKDNNQMIEEIDYEENEQDSYEIPSYTDIIICLMKHDFDNGYIKLKKYLNSIKKSEYEFLILDLIKISIEENDVAFIKPISTLTYLTRDNYRFDISQYIQEFYIAITNSNISIAKLYFDIIKNSEKLNQKCILTKNLETMLIKIENEIKNKENNKAKPNNTITYYQENEEYEKQEELQTENISYDEDIYTNKPEEYVVKNVEKPIPKPKNQTDYSKLINDKLKRIDEVGIVLLKPMKDDEIKLVEECLENFPDITSFVIKNSGYKQMVLKRTRKLENKIDMKKIRSEGDSAYSQKDYSTCISKYRELLEIGNPPSLVYGKLGLAYMKLRKKSIALDYLNVSTYISTEIEKNNWHDFSGLVALLTGKGNPTDKKNYVKMDTTDFNNDTDNYYGIKNMDEIAELISSGMTIDEACESLEIDKEGTMIATLVYAKECYIQGFEELGNEYMKKVERTKGKTEFVNLLYDKIYRDKKFIQNRVEEDHKLLKITLGTRKKK